MKKTSLKHKIHDLQLKAEKALKKAVFNVIRDHQRTGDPLVIWRNGKVVRVSATQLLRRRHKAA